MITKRIMTIRGRESRHKDGSLCKKNLVARMLQEVAMSHDQKVVFKKSKLILKPLPYRSCWKTISST